MTNDQGPMTKDQGSNCGLPPFAIMATCALTKIPEIQWSSMLLTLLPKTSNFQFLLNSGQFVFIVNAIDNNREIAKREKENTFP